MKGLRVLEAINALDGQALTLEQIAERLELTRSNTHRTLQTLTHAGYVQRDPVTGGYCCTLKLFEMGARQLASLDVRTLAAPFMRSLSVDTGETVHLSVLDGIDVVYIDKIDSAQPIRAYSAIGGRAPAYAVATGKALLAFQPADYLDRYRDALVQHTPHTHGSVDSLRRELDAVVQTGVAANRGEWRDGVGGIAAPVFSGFGRVVAALGISGPLERLDTQRCQAMTPLVRRSAFELSRQLGYQGTAFEHSS